MNHFCFLLPFWSCYIVGFLFFSFLFFFFVVVCLIGFSFFMNWFLVLTFKIKKSSKSPLHLGLIAFKGKHLVKIRIVSHFFPRACLILLLGACLWNAVNFVSLSVEGFYRKKRLSKDGYPCSWNRRNKTPIALYSISFLSTCTVFAWMHNQYRYMILLIL